jgi:hypothetical protein
LWDFYQPLGELGGNMSLIMKSTVLSFIFVSILGCAPGESDFQSDQSETSNSVELIETDHQLSLIGASEFDVQASVTANYPSIFEAFRITVGALKMPGSTRINRVQSVQVFFRKSSEAATVRRGMSTLGGGSFGVTYNTNKTVATVSIKLDVKKIKAPAVGTYYFYVQTKTTGEDVYNAVGKLTVN